MPRDVTPIMRPHTVAVLGASATRTTQGNQVIGNLQGAGFKGTIIPVHATAEVINGLPAARGIAALPPGVDTAVVASNACVGGAATAAQMAASFGAKGGTLAVAAGAAGTVGYLVGTPLGLSLAATLR